MYIYTHTYVNMHISNGVVRTYMVVLTTTHSAKHKTKHIATHCNRFFHLKVEMSLCRTPPKCKCLTAAHCSSLQLTAAQYSTLQHIAAHCSTLQLIAAHCNTVQHVAAHCNTLKHTATHCSSLQHIAAHCSTLQLTAAH